MFGLGREPGEKHTSEQCLEFALDQIRSDPNLVKMYVNLILTYDLDMFNTVLWPSATNPADYTRTSTKRPTMKEYKPDEEFYGGTDVVIRVFENDKWDEEGRRLILTVVEEAGELEATVKVVW